ncbi:MULTISPECIES: hypothetical protein [unclassified Neochlamydia]|uniref:hypothetical protein n=1 Tax=unclassified Neochlamydia TaxID=2643326 RepID=UPI00140CDEF1|nr:MULTISPECIES: hypothetical protein [unclassified Neochlamydia]MBS4166666.1 hypothetical protein [Neochlamydia sp. AcF65]
MNKLGLPNAQGNLLGSSRIKITLKNPFYFGVMRIKGELYPHRYPLLISEGLLGQVQDIMAGHNKAPIHYAGHPILFRELITCEPSGCAATGDIKKQKYIYYSCNNSKRTCQKIWVREE